MQGSSDVFWKPLLPSNFILKVESKSSQGHSGASPLPFISIFASHYTHGLVFSGSLDVNECITLGIVLETFWSPLGIMNEVLNPSWVPPTTLALLYFLKKSKGWRSHLPKQKLIKKGCPHAETPPTPFLGGSREIAKRDFHCAGCRCLLPTESRLVAQEELPTWFGGGRTTGAEPGGGWEWTFCIVIPGCAGQGHRHQSTRASSYSWGARQRDAGFCLWIHISGYLRAFQKGTWLCIFSLALGFHQPSVNMISDSR